MARKKIKTIADKLHTVNESFTIHMYDNGFMIEVSGRGAPDSSGETEWRNVKIIVPEVEDLFELIKEAASMPMEGDE